VGGKAMRLIDADALKNALIECTPYAIDPVYRNTNSNIDIFTAMEILDELPTIDAVPVVRGEWKRGREFSSYPRVPFISDAYYCSNCEEEAYWDTDYGQQLFGFCPNCGAKMEDKT
jgi:hypothetical protein